MLEAGRASHRLAGTLAGAVLLAVSGCSGASPSAFSSGEASESPSILPTDSPSPSASVSSPDLPSARPPIHDAPWTDAGSLATVTVDRLPVHDFAGGVFDQLAELRSGTEVFVSFGPLVNDGLDWYEVVFSGIQGDPGNWGEYGSGWIAAGPSGQDPTRLRMDPPRCPTVATAGAIGPMSRLARLQCLGTGSYEFSGIIRGCTDYWEPEEPEGWEWIVIECANLGNEDGTATDLYLHFPPELAPYEINEENVVRLVGHVDDPRASECDGLVSADPPIPTELVKAWSVMHCRGAFVVTELEVTGRVGV